MELYLGADHRGFQLKTQITDWLTEQGHIVIDEGNSVQDPNDDYPDFAEKVARKITEDPDNRRGIVLCGSGTGVAIAANKVPGARASLATNAEIAKAGRNDDNMNILALGADYTSLPEAQEIISAFIATPFAGKEKHVRRVNKISEMEK